MPSEPPKLEDLPPHERLRDVTLSSAPPLHTARTTIGYAIERFHASWSQYRTLTPTLYAIAPTRRGVYVTLGRLRARHGMSWEIVEALFEAFVAEYEATGYLVATAAVGGDPPRALFGLQGHDDGERHYGALDLRTLAPWERAFQTELDLPPEAWDDLWQQAVTESGIARHSVSR